MEDSICGSVFTDSGRVRDGVGAAVGRLSTSWMVETGVGRAGGASWRSWWMAAVAAWAATLYAARAVARDSAWIRMIVERAGGPQWGNIDRTGANGVNAWRGRGEVGMNL